jgi:hypothetical protein
MKNHGQFSQNLQLFGFPNGFDEFSSTDLAVSSIHSSDRPHVQVPYSYLNSNPVKLVTLEKSTHEREKFPCYINGENNIPVLNPMLF